MTTGSTKISPIIPSKNSELEAKETPKHLKNSKENGINAKEKRKVEETIIGSHFSGVYFKVVIFKSFIRGIHCSIQIFTGRHVSLSYFGIRNETTILIRSWLYQDVLKATPDILDLGVTA